MLWWLPANSSKFDLGHKAMTRVKFIYLFERMPIEYLIFY